MNTLTIKTDFNELLGNCSTDEIEGINIEASKAKYEELCLYFLIACNADVIEFEWCDSPQISFEMSEGVDGFEVQEALHEVWRSQRFWIFKQDISKCNSCGKEGNHSTVTGYKICDECINKYAHQTIY